MPPLPRPSIGNHRIPAPRTPPPVPARPAVLLPSIGMNSVESIDDLSGGGMNPVWLVSLRGTPVKLVVKAEIEQNASEVAFAKANIKAMSDVMAVVSPTAVMVRLEPGELEALDTFPARPLTLRTAVKEARQGTKHIIKMKFDPKFFSSSPHEPVSMGHSASMTGAEQARAILLFNGLRDNVRAWQTLGQVVIADTLIGNGDRINVSNNRVMNYGNLIFSRDARGNITEALGYDAIDPFADVSKKMYGTGINIDGDRAANWIESYGQYIKDKSKLPKMGREIVQSINKYRMIPLGLASYTIDEERYLGEGLIQGWDKLANNIGLKVRSGIGIPSGLMARAKYLGFVR